jgi:hypothetical protein
MNVIQYIAFEDELKKIAIAVAAPPVKTVKSDFGKFKIPFSVAQATKPLFGTVPSVKGKKKRRMA